MQKLVEHLVDAAIIDDVENVKALLAKGADPNGFIGGDQLTPLFFAARKNAIHLAKVLLLAGANPYV